MKEKPVEKKEEEKKDELKEYSEGVQKRIAKLTRKMREAERQREEAITFAQSAKKIKKLWKVLSKLDKTMFQSLKTESKQIWQQLNLL